jgi:LysR family glycine cleavage system transcriptional activator
MTNLYNDLPLQHLALFASAARHLNFTQVAEEFGTSQPAVSQRIAALEKELGTALFKRARRGVALTPEGSALYDAVSEPLGAIRSALERLRGGGPRTVLTVATDFAFANFWLMPRLADFQQRAPGIEVRLVTSQNAFDIRTEAVDLAVSFGGGRWPGCDARRLLPELVLPVCSPAFLTRHPAHATAAEILRLPLLHLDSAAPARWLDWQDWARMQQAPAPAAGTGLRLGNYPLLIQAALAGRGVALGWRPLVDELLRAGQLIGLPVPVLSTARGYFLVRPQGRAPAQAQGQAQALDSLADWIERTCAAELADHLHTERAPLA